MLGEIRSFAKRGISFGVETTLSGRGYLTLIDRLKERGSKVHVFFLWVKSVDIALARVKDCAGSPCSSPFRTVYPELLCAISPIG